MHMARKDGYSQYHHLSAIEKQGQEVPALIEFRRLDYPDDLFIVFRHFKDIRNRSASSATPLSWQEIQAWSNVTHNVVTRLEARILTELDDVWLKTYQDLHPPEKPKAGKK